MIKIDQLRRDIRLYGLCLYADIYLYIYRSIFREIETKSNHVP